MISADLQQPGELLSVEILAVKAVKQGLETGRLRVDQCEVESFLKPGSRFLCHIFTTAGNPILPRPFNTIN